MARIKKGKNESGRNIKKKRKGNGVKPRKKEIKTQNQFKKNAFL